MYLYHGQADPPEFSTTDLQKELYTLEQERDQGPANEYMIDAFQRMGKEKYLRLIELRLIIRDHRFFTATKMHAQTAAGGSGVGYIIVMNVPDEIAAKHHVLPEEVGAAGEKVYDGAENYAFSGAEIADNFAAWEVKVEKQ